MLQVRTKLVDDFLDKKEITRGDSLPHLTELFVNDFNENKTLLQLLQINFVAYS
jgi:hypothetical protein